MSIALHTLAALMLAILLVVFFLRFSEIEAAFSGAMTILRPIVVALILSYFCNPLMKLGEKYVFGWLDRFPRFPKRGKRIFSLLLSYLLILLVIAGILLLTVPEIVNNYESLITNLTNFVLIGVEWVDSILHLANIDSISELIVQNSNTLISMAAGILADVAVAFLNLVFVLVLSVVLSFFMLLYKESWTAGLKRITLSLLPRRWYAEINDTLIFANRTFGRYLLGSVFDSILVGLETFLMLTIFGVPYAALVSVVVGITNIIPYFGPFIGAIPSFFIILTQDVFKAFLFLVLILVIQQIDGNLINPRIVGKTTSINSMWVILAITAIGGWLGILGMVIAIPLFSVIYMLVRRMANARLEKKGLTTDSEAYASAFSVSQFRRNEEKEQQQQKRISLLKPIDETLLEETIGYEQLAIELTAILAQNEDNMENKKALDFALLEDFDHLYRYANLLKMDYGIDAETLVGKYTEIMPGRPTITEHRHPLDSIRVSMCNKNASDYSKLVTSIITAAEQQTMNFYMNMAQMYKNDLGRRLFMEIGMIEEQHVSQYESLKDPKPSWLECWVMHEYTECYLYYSMKEQETCEHIKQIWEEHFEMEVAHLKLALSYLKKYEGKDIPDLFVNPEFPKLLIFGENKEYVRHIIETTVYNTAHLEEYININDLKDCERFKFYQDAVNTTDDMVASHKVIDAAIRLFGRDYRFEVEAHPIEELQLRTIDNTTVGRETNCHKN